MARADQLHADRQATHALQQRQSNAWHAAKCPQRAECRIASGSETLRRGAGRGRSQDCIVALFKKFDETSMNRIDLAPRVLIINCAHVTTAFNLLSQLL